MNVVIVESPAKAKTINKYLGKDYSVVASFGHIRDLPSKDGSVDPEKGFAMDWEVDAGARKRVNEISSLVKGADTLYLATDPDREGEAISWHVLEVLKAKGALKNVDVKRVVFNEITKSAVQKGMANPRDLDQELVDAYLARRALDYLVGFNLSPVLWRKLPGARSAGRVQSVALRLVSDRELEIDAFVPEEYWDVDVDFVSPLGDPFTARLVELDGEKLQKFSLPNEEKASAAKRLLESAAFTVRDIEAKPTKRHPYAPFTTSTLQQEASRKLGFNATRTMRTAQKLYEGVDLDGETVGLITYMRTDGVSIAAEAVEQARKAIAGQFGDKYVPASPRLYKAKAKNAQEAHEAIRPTSMMRHPKDMARVLGDDERRLYELIWKRTIASQMESATIERTTATISSRDGSALLRATGSVVRFDGFLKLYQEGRDDTEGRDDDKRLPPLAVDDKLERKDVRANQHFTEPPPRYTEASLVKKLEELGIGRPSTYASILDVLRERNYVRMDGNRFIPEDKGILVTAFLFSFFQRYVEYDFTASLEEKLDEVSDGKLGWKRLLEEFWTQFKDAIEQTQGLRVANVLDALNDILAPHVFPKVGEGDPRKCPACADGQLSLKLGKFGAFIGCSNYPDCNYTRQLGTNGDAAPEMEGPRVLGLDPESGMEVTVRSGRFGPYIQLGEPVDKTDKPKRASIPKDAPPDGIDLEKALALLSLPREIGKHPETGKPITAAIGRYGPYVAHDGKFASLSNTEEVFTVGINRAVDLLATQKKGRAAAEVLKDLGTHPDDDAPVQVLNGRYGPYVKHGKTNATLPKGKTPEDITLEEALALVAAKAGAKGKKKAAPRKAAAKKPAAKKKTAAKKKPAVAKA